MVASAGIIIIGDEILSGRTKDSNINWIACELENLGIRLKEARIIPDDSSTIIKTNGIVTFIIFILKPCSKTKANKFCFI